MVLHLLLATAEELHSAAVEEIFHLMAKKMHISS